MRVIETLAAPVRRFEWRLVKVREVVVETFGVKSLLLHARGWREHLPGQQPQNAQQGQGKKQWDGKRNGFGANGNGNGKRRRQQE